MKMFKRVIAAGAALMIAVTGMTMGASALFATYQDSYRLITAYTATTVDKASSNGVCMNLSSTPAEYSIRSALYYKVSGIVYSYTASPWNTDTLSQNENIKATSTHNRNYNATYSAKTLVDGPGSFIKTVQSEFG